MTKHTLDTQTTDTNLSTNVVKANPVLFERPDVLPGSLSLYWDERDGTPVLGTGTAVSLEARGPDRFRRLQESGQSLLDTITIDNESGVSLSGEILPSLYGGFSFRSGEEPEDTCWTAFPDAYLFLPELLLFKQKNSTLMAVTGTKERIDEVMEQIRAEEPDATKRRAENEKRLPELERKRSVPDPETWKHHVRALTREIGKGELEKVVLSSKRIISFSSTPAPGALIHRLRQTAPSLYQYYVSPGGSASCFLGASPENLISLSGDQFYTESLAGTARTGGSEEQNEVLARRLAENEKDQQEHSYVVQDIQRRLASLSNDITVEDQSVHKFPGIQHLRTPITGTLSSNTHILKLVERLHPTPAVGGVPRQEALAKISELEPFSRGWYAGGVGRFNRRGDGCFSVAIRSALLQNRTGHLFAGAGIVSGSEPENEWEEVTWKLKAMDNLLKPETSPSSQP